MLSLNRVVLSSFTEEDNFYSCCTNFYESDIVRFLLGDSFHPGGIELTKQLTKTFNLRSGNLIIDIACGLGNSLIQTINLFQVVGIGIDLSFANLQRALERGKKGNIDTQLALIQADTHNLPFRSSSTKSIMSECSLCIFLNKSKAIKEIFRVLEYGGQFGFTDVTKTREWPSELNDMFYRVACIADAKSPVEYRVLLEIGGFSDIETLDRKDVIYDLYSSLKKKILLLNIAWKFNKMSKYSINISQSDFKKINKTIDLIKEFVDYKYGSYIMMIALKSEP